LALATRPERGPQVPVLLTDAVRGEGVPALVEALDARLAALREDGGLERRRGANLAAEVFTLASSRARAHVEASVAGDEALQHVLEAVERRELDPLSAV